MKSLVESILRSNGAMSKIYYFKYYDVFDNPDCSINVGSIYRVDANGSLDEMFINKEYDKLPSNIRIDRFYHEIKAYDYSLHSRYEEVWDKLANLVLACKNEKEIIDLINKAYPHDTSDKYDNPFDVKIIIEEKQGINIIYVYIYKPSYGRVSFPHVHLKLYMYSRNKKPHII